MKKPLLIAGIITSISAAGLTAGVANAATSNNSSDNPMSSLVDAISTKFNLDKTQVQQVFDEQKTKMDANREQEAKDEVAQLVKDGKLTQAQADVINTKRAELQKEREANKDNFQNLTEEQRKAEMEKRKTELESWAKSNNIDTQYLRYVMGGGRGHGHGGPGGPGGTPKTDSSTNSSSSSSN